MDAVLADYRSASLDDARRALFAFVEKVNAAADEVTRADVEEARSAGWSDAALYDALTVCALFNFYNVWVDAAGVSGLSAAGFAASGRRLATDGYLMEGEAE